MINLSLKRKYFEAIKFGKKTVEGRLNGPKFKNLLSGDFISFTTTDPDESILVKVIDVNLYPSFEAMLQNEGIEKMLPGIDDLKVGVGIYESFPGYKAQVEKAGALAIKILFVR